METIDGDGGDINDNVTAVAATADGSVEIYRYGDCEQHCHDLDMSDQVKKPSAFRKVAAAEVSKAYKVAHVSRTIRAVDTPSDRQILRDAGGKYFNLKDNHNAGAFCYDPGL